MAFRIMSSFKNKYISIGNLGQCLSILQQKTQYAGRQLATMDKEKPLSLRIKETKQVYEKLLDYPVTYNEENSEAVVEYPGLMYNDYDIHTAQPTLWGLMKIFYGCYVHSFERSLDNTGRKFRDMPELYRSHLQFYVCVKFDFSRAMYDPLVRKHPLLLYSYLGYVGNTSFSELNIMKAKTGQVLAEETVQSVVVDSVKRRPIALPEWWKKKHGKFARLKSPMKIEQEVRPRHACVYQTKVGFSETDQNEHANWTLYVIKALDGAHHCSKNGGLQHFSANFECGVKTMEILFADECAEGDVIDIYTWESEKEVTKLFAHVCKESKLLCQIVLEYFPGKRCNSSL